MSNDEKRTILLVEDEFIIALAQKTSLEKYGYNVITANTGEEAIDIFIKSDTIDLILMDINLGEGIDVTETARIILKKRIIPIIILSSHTESEVVKKTESITSYGYVLKDSGTAVLDASIKMAFKLFEANTKAQVLKEKLEATLDALPEQLFEVGLDGICYDVHSPRHDLLNVSPASDIIGRNLFDILPRDIADIIMSAVNEAHEKGYSTGKQYKLTVPAGNLWFEISVSRKGDATGEHHFIILRRDITDSKLSDLKHLHVAHLYALLSQINHAIIWTRHRDELFNKICKVAIEYGEFRMAWIGLINESEKKIKPAASAGYIDGYLDNILITTTDDATGRGPSGYAIREGKIITSYDIASDPNMIPWREESLKRGYNSSASVPFFLKGTPVGVLNLYASETGFFTGDELALLQNIGENISFALNALLSETEREQAEDSLRESEQVISTMFSQTTESIVLIDSETGRFVDFNTSAHNGLGYSSDEFSTLSVTDIQGELTLAKTTSSFQHADDGMLIDFETRLRRKDESLCEVALTLRPLNLGGRSMISAVWRDISLQKREEKELKKINEELDLLISSLSSIIIGVSIKDRITHWNPYAEKVFGIDASMVIGKQFYETGINWNWETIYEGISKCILGDRSIRIDEMRFNRQDKRNGILGLTVNPLKRGGDVLEGFIILGQDLTEQKILESQLLQSNKLEALGQLAAGVAHEINNPLQYVGDNLRFMNTSFAKVVNILDIYRKAFQKIDSPVELNEIFKQANEYTETVKLPFLLEQIPEALSQSLEGAERVSKIVLSMKAFSHPGTGKKMPANINQSIENTITVSRNQWKYEAEVKLELDLELPSVPCFESELNQVLLNLIVNAADAIHDAKEKKVISEGLIIIKTMRDDFYVSIIVEDNGAGIPLNIQEKVFEPFFTTKEVGKGTGQGLAISYAIIVEKHHGMMYFESEPGKGTRFIIKLPLEELE